MATISTRTRGRTLRSSTRKPDSKPSLIENDGTGEITKRPAKKRKQSKRKQASKNEENEPVTVPQVAAVLPNESPVAIPVVSKLTEVTPIISVPEVNEKGDQNHDVNENKQNVKELSKSEDSSALKPKPKIGSKEVSGTNHGVIENGVSTTTGPKNSKSETQHADEQPKKRLKNRKKPEVVIDYSHVNEQEQAKEVFSMFKSESFKNSKVKGVPKSGRTWKTEHTSRFSQLKKVKPLRSSWEHKMKEKAEKKSIKLYEKQLRESREIDVQKKKDKKKAKIERKRLNDQKSEVVQVIKDTAKIKRMKKKQLRQLQKR